MKPKGTKDVKGQRNSDCGTSSFAINMCVCFWQIVWLHNMAVKKKRLRWPLHGVSDSLSINDHPEQSSSLSASSPPPATAAAVTHLRVLLLQSAELLLLLLHQFKVRLQEERTASSGYDAWGTFTRADRGERAGITWIYLHWIARALRLSFYFLLSEI